MQQPLAKNLNYTSYSSQLRRIYDKPVARTSTALILTLVTSAFFGMAAIRPTLATVSELMREIEDKKEIKVKLDHKASALSSAQQELLLINDKLQLIETAIPTQNRQKLLITKLEYLCWLNQTRLMSMKVDVLTTFAQKPVVPETIVDAFPSYKINLTVDSDSTDNLRRLLGRLDNLDRVLRIQSVSFSVKNAKEVKGVETIQNHQMMVVLNAYWNPQAQIGQVVGEQ